jgi:hypothetical protein
MLAAPMQTLSSQSGLQDIVCPKCEGPGIATHVAVGHTASVVDFLCLRCAHEWFEQQELPRGRILPFSRPAAKSSRFWS